MLWDDEPATEQQLVHLRNAGYTGAGRLSRTEAARLIRDYRRYGGPPPVSSPVRPVPAAILERPPVPNEPPRMSGPTEELSETTRLHAYRLRQAAEVAQRALATSPDAPNVRADAVATSAARREFWLDTCCEVKEMRIGSMQVCELYQRHGCRFFAPTQEQVQELLGALDAALSLWDRDHPELFYQALELNFPQLVRRAFKVA